jgi:hypothetical protein
MKITFDLKPRQVERRFFLDHPKKFLPKANFWFITVTDIEAWYALGQFYYEDVQVFVKQPFEELLMKIIPEPMYHNKQHFWVYRHFMPKYIAVNQNQGPVEIIYKRSGNHLGQAKHIILRVVYSSGYCPKDVV